MSSSFSEIGDSSFKLTRLSNTGVWSEFRVNQQLPYFETGITVYTPNNSATVLTIIIYEDWSQNISSTIVPANNEPQRITLNSPYYNPSKNILRISLRIALMDNIDDYCYIDNAYIKPL